MQQNTNPNWMSEADEAMYRMEVRKVKTADLYEMLDGARNRWSGDDENIRGMVITEELQYRRGKGRGSVKGW